MEKSDLLPCPCCGGKAQFAEVTRRYGFDVAIECANCGLNTGRINRYDNNPEDKAAEIWNRRVALESQAMSEASNQSNTDKLDDVTLAILSQSILENNHPGLPGIQIDPEFDLQTLARLYTKGFLTTEPHPPVNVIWLTPEGKRRSRELFKKYFGQ